MFKLFWTFCLLEYDQSASGVLTATANIPRSTGRYDRYSAKWCNDHCATGIPSSSSGTCRSLFLTCLLIYTQWHVKHCSQWIQILYYKRYHHDSCGLGLIYSSSRTMNLTIILQVHVAQEMTIILSCLSSTTEIIVLFKTLLKYRKLKWNYDRNASKTYAALAIFVEHGMMVHMIAKPMKTLEFIFQWFSYHLREDNTWARVDMEYFFECSNTRRDIPYWLSTNVYYIVNLLCKLTEDRTFDDIICKISDHFLKISEDFQNFSLRPHERFQTFSKHFRRLTKIFEDNQRLAKTVEDVLITYHQIWAQFKGQTWYQWSYQFLYLWGFGKYATGVPDVVSYEIFVVVYFSVKHSCLCNNCNSWHMIHVKPH